MFLQEKAHGDMIEVLDTFALIDPFQDSLRGRYKAGEDRPDAMQFAKTELVFCSGEALPRCWTDPAYRVGTAG